MDHHGLHAEIVEQWGDEFWNDTDGMLRTETVRYLVAVSMIAWHELAGRPSDSAMALVRQAARFAGTGSGKPRVVLRKLIEDAQQRYGWQPTVGVMTAAGMRSAKKSATTPAINGR